MAQYYHLNVEPDPAGDPVVKEERRRVFWSLYLLDKLISCSRERAPTIQDGDCKLQMPSNDCAFRDGVEQRTPELKTLTGDSPKVTSLSSPSHFSLVILMAATLNRVAQYALRDPDDNPHVVPWSHTSDYAAFDSTLLQLELNFNMNTPLETVLLQTCMSDGVIDQQLAGPLVYARSLFHLARCLLHHPFLLQQRLSKVSSKLPPDFLNKAWETSRSHAKAVVMLQNARNHGYVVLSSFYAYCTMVAGSIHSIFVYDSDDEVRKSSLEQYEASLQILHKLSHYWKSAGRMVCTRPGST